MGIEGINSQPTRGTESVAEQAGVQRTERHHHGRHARGAEAASGDTLEVSARGRELANAQQAVDAAPDVRADKVADIKQRLADGTYHVPADVLARKLLGDK
ncbi:MAG TPA: flagellar biosynthesis anti-sigma factor FlgM [Chloroflexota bacterium]|nr:flagellar biosynthesis anti-sigma factor FlgM [Chloroflexota bacterium]